MFLLGIIMLFTIAIVYYYYTNFESKRKLIDMLIIWKWKKINNEPQSLLLKIVCLIISMT